MSATPSIAGGSCLLSSGSTGLFASMVRQSAKRTGMPIVLSIEQIAALLGILKESTRTMVFLAVFKGLRVGELLGLKWKDIDFQKISPKSLLAAPK